MFDPLNFENIALVSVGDGSGLLLQADERRTNNIVLSYVFAALPVLIHRLELQNLGLTLARQNHRRVYV